MANQSSGGPWARVVRLLEGDVRQRDVGASALLWRGAVSLARVVCLVREGFSRHRLTTRAAALTYTTVFSLVPMLAVALAMFEAFGGLDHARNVLLPHAVAYLAVGVREEFASRLEQTLDNLGGGAIGTAGFVLLILAAFSLLRSMEDAFNDIWGAERSRSVLQRLVVYWFVLTITPLVLLAVSVPPVLRRLEPLRWLLDLAGASEFFFATLLPLVFVCGAFSLMYAVLTSAHISWQSAAFAGVFGGALWSGAVYAYAYYVQHSQFYATIYGSLSAIPIFLLWLYLSWLIVLLGAQVGFAVENLGAYRQERAAASASRAARELLALRIAVEVAGRFLRGGEPIARQELAPVLQVSGRAVNEAVAELIDAGVIVQGGTGGCLTPARDPRRLSPAVLLELLRYRGEAHVASRRDRLSERLDGLYAEMAHAAAAAVSGVSIADLADGASAAAPHNPS